MTNIETKNLEGVKTPWQLSVASTSWLLFLCILLLPKTTKANDFQPFPKAGDAYWTTIPEEMRTDYIALGEQYHGQPWTSIPQETFAEFRTTGNRTNYEAASFGIRRQFACLVMAEIMECRGRFLSDICRGLHYFIEQEPWWGIPAHYPKAQPERQTQVIDLFNAETASMLAWTLYMLGDQIEAHEQGLAESVRMEIVSRFLLPTLNEEQGWKHNANNWNTWITSNWLECALICETDSTRLSSAIEGVKSNLRVFLDGYPTDGGCEEGVGYWDRAAASFFESLWFLDNWNSKSSLNAPEQLAAMGRFITTMHIHDLRFVNFSDASAENLPNINILFPFGAWLHNEPMMKMAAYIGEHYDYRHHPSRLFLQSGNYPTLGRELLLLSMLPQFLQTKPQQPRTADAYLKDSQIMVASNNTWFLACKGGNNAESHNHNDIGTFILYHNDQPVIIDLGRDTYTAKTFSSQRYELMNNRSMYHNVPLVNGREQAAGAQFKAENPESRSSSLTLSLANAYLQEAGIQTWQQTIRLDRQKNRVEYAVSFAINDSQSPTSLTLMCYGEPQNIAKGILRLADGQVTLKYDKALLMPSWERVVMPEGLMHDQWGDNIYRLSLFLTTKALKKGAVGLSFQ